MLDVASLGQKIRRLRKQRELTQSQFAEAICVSFQAVSNWERGIVPPELDNLMAIAEFFGVLVDDLLRAEEEALFLGVDGGGTKTEFVVTDRRGHVRFSMVKSGSNPNDIGMGRTEALICEGVQEILRQYPTVQNAYFGLAGVGVGENAKKLTAALQSRFPRLGVQVRSDVYNLLAMDDEVDMAVISGTGSVVFLKEQGIRLGGAGYLFDRAGSAFDMGRDAISAALEEEEAGQPESLLHKLLCAHLGKARIWDALDGLYTGGRRAIATLAPVVFEACAQGDATAEGILEQSAARLGRLLEIAIHRHGAKPRAIAGGGIFTHYFSVYSGYIRKYTQCRLIPCKLPPVYGACREGCRMDGNPLPREFFENFSETYREQDGGL